MLLIKELMVNWKSVIEYTVILPLQKKAEERGQRRLF